MVDNVFLMETISISVMVSFGLLLFFFKLMMLIMITFCELYNK